jgi:dienelactone hydrolase
MLRLVSLFLVLLVPALPLSAEAPRLPRDDLLLLPDGTRATTPAQWAARRKHTLDAFHSLTGPLPTQKVPLDVQITETVDCGSYTRQLLTYATDPGNRVPAYLCVPKVASPAAPVPAVLCLHPTEATIGHKVVVGLGGKPHRQYAAELAERGFVTLSPAYTLLANYQPDLKALGYRSGTMKSIWDNLCGLDLLDSLPQVKRTKGYAAIGHSLGGHNAIFTAIHDSRISVIVSSCGFDSVVDYYGGNIKGWTQERYIPEMTAYLGRAHEVPFDHYELVASLAPRHFYINAPLRDSNFKHDSVARIVKAARKVYGLHGAGDHLILNQPDAEHDFPDQPRFAAYDLIAKELAD